MQKKFKQLVLVEYRNCAPFIYEMVSDKKITLAKVVRYFEKTEGWNENYDNITFVDEVSQIEI
jgi:hypothetical protein